MEVLSWKATQIESLTLVKLKGELKSYEIKLLQIRFLLKRNRNFIGSEKKLFTNKCSRSVTRRI